MNWYAMEHSAKHLLQRTLRICTRAVLYALLFSFMINLLMLAMPLYMLQIIDRVLSTGSVDTLVMLSVIVIGTFVCLGFLQASRSYIFLSVGSFFDRELSPSLLRASISETAQRHTGSASQSLRDLGVLKGFLTKQGLGALFDVPWTPIYLLAIYFIHPLNALVAVVGAGVLLFLAYLNEKMTAHALQTTNDHYIQSMAEVDSAARNADVVEAMGMKSTIVHNWEGINRRVVKYYNTASHWAILFSTCTQVVKLLTQMFMVGVGAYLVLEHAMSPGGIVANAILAGKLLAPFGVAITAWRNFVNARQSYSRIHHVLNNMQVRSQQIELPEPSGELSAEKVFYQPQGVADPLIRNVSFQIESGVSVGIIGKSGAGKTTLCKLLAGILKPSTGAVRLDSIDVFEWGRDYIGNCIGYLPQNVELFPGSVKENIARMDKGADDQAVFEAAKATGVHRAILRLSNGYDTDVRVLSAGMCQRVGLARAFYQNPKVIILDEPNANLDSEGDEALLKALRHAKKKGITLFIISHRPSVLAYVDQVIVVHAGKIAAFGERDTVLKKHIGKVGS